jgi:hypothetical protein
LSATRKAAGPHGILRRSVKQLQDDTRSDLESVSKEMLGSLSLSTKAMIVATAITIKHLIQMTRSVEILRHL